MYLNGNAPGAGPGRLFTQISQVMRLTAILLLAGCLQVSANGIAQTITISEKNAPLDKIFKQIEKQTSYVFFYDDHILINAKKVDVNLKNASIEQVLQACLKDMPLNYQIVGNTIIVVMRPKVQAMMQTTQNVGLSDVYIDVKGRVTSENGEPIAGVTVRIKGTQQATSTNGQGDFFLANTDKNAVLVFSGSNVETFEVKVNGQAELIVKLRAKINKLDEVQIIAYGSTTKRFNTGNVSSIKGEDIQKQPINNPLLALEGRVPGLFVTQANGIPGGGISLQIQGANSIAYGNDPFFVIDGVPFVSQNLTTVAAGPILGNSAGTSGSRGGNGNPLSYINSSDIESIEILKDADATAIYGSRAANGAILITTKKGKVGKTKIDLSLQEGFAQAVITPDLINTSQYIKMRKEALRNDNLLVGTTDYDINGTWDSSRYTDWKKALLGGTAHYSDINASISGGTGNTSYLISGAYHRESTVFPGSFNDQKSSVHFNITSASVNHRFRIQLIGNYLVDNNKLPTSDITYAAMQLPPNAPALKNEDGTLNWALNSAGTTTWPSSNNPLALLLNTFQSKTNNLVSNANISYQIWDGLEVKASIGYTNLQTNEYTIYPATGVQPLNRTTSARTAFSTNSNINSWILEPQISYKNIIGNGKLNVLVGGSIQQKNSNGIYLYGNGFGSDALVKNISAASTFFVLGIADAIYKYNGIFSRINYSLHDKYLFNLTARRDGTSRFGIENQFHNFGAASVAWVFSEEAFIKKNISFLSFGKLRCSYGSTGSDQIPDYLFMNLYNPTSSVNLPYQGLTGLLPNGLPNPYLQWEETRKLQSGLDLGFLKDRLLFSINYAYNRSSNQLLSYALPSITGNNTISANFPSVIENNVWEFSLNVNNFRIGKLSWEANLNLTIPRNKLKAFPDLGSSSYANTLVIGQPLNVVKLYHGLGVDPATGMYLVADRKGNPTASPNSLADKNILVNINPKYYGGLQNIFRYNGIELDFLFQFVRQEGFNNVVGTMGVSSPAGTKFVNQSTAVLNRWQSPGNSATVQRFSSNSNLQQSYSLFQASDVLYSDALSFIRLKNVSVSYELPQQWISRAKLLNVRVFVHGQNLLTLTKYNGLDPETRSSTVLPPLRTFTTGLQIGF